MDECSLWIDEFINLDFSMYDKNPVIIYQSPPILIRKGTKIKLEVTFLKGDWNCGALICKYSGKLILRLTKKTTGEAYEFTVPYQFESSLGPTSEVEGSKTIEAKPISGGKYYLQILIPPGKKYSGYVKAAIKAYICK